MSFVMDSLYVGDNNNLHLGGCDLGKIAEEYKTPVYVMDENQIRKNCMAYIDAISENYGGNGLVLYASKALSCKYIYKLMNELKMGIDVVSGGELYTAKEAGFPMDKVYFHGNNKSRDEIAFAIDCNVGRFIVDNTNELCMINDLASQANKNVGVLFRIKPGVEAHTHEFIKTGQIDSKFGFALETGEAEEAVKLVSTMQSINFAGIHAHIGSQIFGTEPFKETAVIMMEFAASISEKYGVTVSELNLGGGFGIKYTQEDEPLPYSKYAEPVFAVIRDICARRNIMEPKLLLEPGRTAVGSAGLTLYTVGCIKDIPGVRTYVSVDGGMADNPRPITYGSKYDAHLVSNPIGEIDKKVTIAGKFCESGDILIHDIGMPKIETGDLLAVLATGAYNYSMASNYNRVPRPPVVIVKDGQSHLAVRRETYEDLVRNDM